MDRRGFVTIAAGAIAGAIAEEASAQDIPNQNIFVVLPPKKHFMVPLKELEKYRVSREEYDRRWDALHAPEPEPEAPASSSSIWDEMDEQAAMLNGDDEDVEDPEMAEAGGGATNVSSKTVKEKVNKPRPRPKPRTRSAAMGVRG